MLPTPSTSHINVDKVYEPCEDSYLFLDTLSSQEEVHFLTNSIRQHSSQERTSVPLVAEIGTGSGILLAFVTAYSKKIFGTANVLTLGTDVNLFACQDAIITVRRACQDSSAAECGQFLGVTQSDLVHALRDHSVDVLFFNPPYVPSPGVPPIVFNQGDGDCSPNQADPLAFSYEGGLDGLEVTNRLLAELPSILNRDGGVAYVLLCQQNQPEKVVERLTAADCNWSVRVVGKSGKQAGWEKLQIIRINYKPARAHCHNVNVSQVALETLQCGI